MYSTVTFRAMDSQRRAEEDGVSFRKRSQSRLQFADLPLLALSFRVRATLDPIFSLLSYPIVFFSQTADPVTPLISARKMAAGFGEDSARVVVQDG